MKLSLKIALRFLRYNLGQTILIIAGIAIGVSVQVFIGLLIQGLQKDLIDKTIGGSPQITIMAEKNEKTIKDWQEIASNVQKTDSTIQDISPAVDGAAFLITEDSSDPVLVRGFDLNKAEGIYGFQSKITEGRLPVENQVLVGKNLKEDLNLSLGEKIIVATAEGIRKEYEISGFYDFKVSAVNKSWVIADIKTSRELFGLGDEITSLEMKVSDVFTADSVAAAIAASLNNDKLAIDNWKAQNEELLSGLNGQSVSSLMIQVFVMVSVVLGISSVLAITVIQKSKEIGILKAMGIKDGTASLIFLLQGLILGVFGALAGVALGLGLSVAFTKFALNPDGTPVIGLYLNYSFIALSGVIAVAASVIASLIPARKSLKLNPMEVIRNG
ncbi:MAG: ABC transporter permease [Eubacteriaceae bacterium]|nr:ABC transporter permease [Eubacteriaceae bacterium]